jgi:uncharacterized protein (DUF1778 family)
MHTTIEKTRKASRLRLRATASQEALLRLAADVSHKSLNDYILDSACLAAEYALIDQRLFMVPGERYGNLLDFLDRPEQKSKGLQELLSRQAPWNN